MNAYVASARVHLMLCCLFQKLCSYCLCSVQKRAYLYHGECSHVSSSGWLVQNEVKNGNMTVLLCNVTWLIFLQPFIKSTTQFVYPCDHQVWIPHPTYPLLLSALLEAHQYKCLPLSQSYYALISPVSLSKALPCLTITLLHCVLDCEKVLGVSLLPRWSYERVFPSNEG